MIKKFIFSILAILILGFNINAQWKIDEGFETDGLPSTWTTIDEGDGMEWWDDEEFPRTGQKAVGVYVMENSDDWLITPKVAIDAGDEFSFWLSSYYEKEENIYVKVSTSDTEIESFSDLNPPVHFTQSAENYIKYSYDLSDYAGQEIYVAIRCTGESHTDNMAGYAVVDDVKLGKEPLSEVTVGTGTETDIHLPMAPYWKYSYTQVIYTAEEIGLSSGKALSKIAYHYNGNAAWSDHAKIFIGHTTLSDFGSSNWIAHENMQLVYDGDFSVSDDAWVEFEFDFPFVYNGTDNLIIGFWDDADALHGTNDDFFCTNATTSRALLYRSDTYNYNPETPGIPIKVSYFPNIRMTFNDLQEEPVLQTNKDEINFGEVSIVENKTEEIIVSNMGNSNLEINDIQFSGQDNTKFSIMPEFSSPVIIASGEAQSFQITYMPQTAGTHNASLDISSNGGTKNITLTGTAYDPTVSSFPYNESFESNGTEFPQGWTNPEGKWYVGVEPQDGLKSAAIRYKDNGSLISPPFIIPENMEMSYWWKDADISANKVIGHDTTFFEISEDNGQNWVTLDTLSMTGSSDVYQKQTYDLAAYNTKTVLFRWRNVTDGTFAAYGTGIDNISVNEKAFSLTPPFIEPFSLDTQFPEEWKTYAGLLSDNSNLSSDWTRWILQNYANDGTDNIGVETSFFISGGSWLVSPTIHLEEGHNFQLEFDLALTEFQDNAQGTMEGDDSLKVIVSTDNGQTWTNAADNLLREYNAQSNISNNQHEVISLAGISGDIKIAFYVESTEGSNDSEIFIDNVAVTGSYEAPTNFVANLEACLVNMTWSAPSQTTDLQGYKVFRGQTQINEVPLTELNYTDTLDADGTYTYYVTAVYAGGESSPSNSAEVIFANAGISVSGTSFAQELEQGSTAVQNLTIQNTGSGSLSFNIEIVAAGTEPGVAGELIKSIPAPNDMLAYGAGFDNGNIWTSDVYFENHENLYKVNQSGELVHTLNVDWVGGWTADIEATEDYLYLVNVDVAGDNGIKKVNKATGELISSITGEFSTDGSSVSHGLAYNQTADEFWVGGWFHDKIYHTDSQGNTISTISTSGKGFHDVTGLAWHPNGNNGTGSLFVVARNPYQIYELNPESGEIIQSFPTYNNINMNALSIGDDGSLWTAAMGETSIYNITSGVGGAPTIDWLSVNTVTGEVQAGESADIELSFNSENLAVGTYEANLIITHNVCGQEDITIPVTLTVTSSSVAVTGVSVNPTTAEIKVGQTQQLTASVEPVDATNQNVTWTSSDDNVATVDASGLVSAVAAGNAVITVTTQDGNKTATCNVSVSDDTSVENKELEAVSIYPNPAEKFLYIKTNAEINSIQLINLAGKTIQTFDAKSRRLDVGNIAPGIYFLKLQNNQKTHVHQLIVK